ncbi:MAG: hypothetical protein ACI9MC_003601, partial [Kiritimatiellia bacterium]
PELHPGRLVSADPDCLVVELDPSRTQRGFVPLHHASLALWVKRQPYSVVCTVRSFVPGVDGKAPRLTLSVPRDMASSVKGHPTYRVPVEAEAEVFVSSDANRQDKVSIERVRPFNVGPTGLQLRYARDADPGLTLGDELSLILEVESHRVPIECMVCRADVRRYELFFTAAIRGREVAPPEDVLLVVQQLQRMWLASRRDKADGGERKVA